MRWKTNANDKLEIGWPKIKKELETVGNIENVDVLGFDMAVFIVDGGKKYQYCFFHSNHFYHTIISI